MANNLKKLRKMAGLTQDELAEKMGTSRDYIAKLESGARTLGAKWIERAAKALEVPAELLIADSLPKSIPFGNPPESGGGNIIPLPNAGPIRDLKLPDRTLPVYGQAIGGVDGRFQFNGLKVAEVACHPSLENVPGAYAVFMSGESMSPRYEPGETIYVHPHKSPRKHDYVVVQLKPQHDGDSPEGYVKRYVSRNADYLVLDQLNPVETIKIPAERVLSVHLIMGTG